MMSWCSSRKSRIAWAEDAISVGGMTPSNWVTKIFSGALRTSAGSFTTSVAG